MPTRSKKTVRPDNNTPDQGKAAQPIVSAGVFPIVGVGASAGGVQAFTRLVRGLPADPGLAIIFVLHTDKHESALAEVLQRATKIRVQFASNGAAIERDHIYVSSPDSELAVVQGKLRVEKRRKGMNLPIDLLFSTLAEDQRSRAVGVILSGSASDGTLGTKAIKAEGGINFAQDDTAQFTICHARRSPEAPSTSSCRPTRSRTSC